MKTDNSQTFSSLDEWKQRFYPSLYEYELAKKCKCTKSDDGTILAEETINRVKAEFESILT